MQDLLLFEKLVLGLNGFPICICVSPAQLNQGHELRSKHSDSLTTNPTRSKCASAFFFFRLGEITNSECQKKHVKLPNHRKILKLDIKNFFGTRYITTSSDKQLQTFLEVCLLLKKTLEFFYHLVFFCVGSSEFSLVVVVGVVEKSMKKEKKASVQIATIKQRHFCVSRVWGFRATKRILFGMRSEFYNGIDEFFLFH